MGADLDTHSDWFCEACWNGEYANGDFDLTNIVFGSSARFRDNMINFVSSGYISDRLQHIQLDQTGYISNSFACLTASLKLRVDPWYPGYYEDFSSIGDGLDVGKTSIITASFSLGIRNVETELRISAK